MAGFEIKVFPRLSEVIEAVRSFEGEIVYIAGGTDLINRMREDTEPFGRRLMIDLSQVEELGCIRREGERIRIGAGTTFSEIARSRLIMEKGSCLAQAAGQLGSAQIRNRATLGGNLAGASPAADSLPSLRVLEACLRTVGPKGDRSLPVQEVALDVWRSSLLRNELITEISFPALDEGSISGFQKIGSRTAVSIARFNMAMKVKYDPHEEKIEEGKIALGTLGRRPLCPEEVETFLRGKRVDRTFAFDLADLLSEKVGEAIKERPSRAYKMSAVKGLTLDMLENLFGTRFDPAVGEDWNG